MAGRACASTRPAELDDGISEMIDIDGPVMVDCRVDQARQLLPDDPVGRGAHRDAAARPTRSTGEMDDEAKALVLMQHQGKKLRAERHTLAVTVDNEPGILARIAGLFSGARLQYREPDRGRGHARTKLSPHHHRHHRHAAVIEQIMPSSTGWCRCTRCTDLTDDGPACRARAGAGQGRRRPASAGSRRCASPTSSAPAWSTRTHRQLRLRGDRHDRRRSTPSST